MQDRYDVAIVGAGAAGLAAARRLAGSPLSIVVLEARERIGGRAWTQRLTPDLPVDFGCEWLHSADRNLLVPMVEHAGFALDRTPPAWGRQAGNIGFPREEQAAFGRAYDAFEARLAAAAGAGKEGPAADFLEPGGRWNPLIDAVSSYYNGAEYAYVSVQDYAAYEDSGVNFRVRGGYGAAIAALGAGAPVVTDCPVTTIHRDGAELRLETPRGTLSARAVIVAVPTPHLAQGGLAFSPGLPEKREAAAGLPLGLADKVFLALSDPEALPADQHLFGATDRTETGSYNLRPSGQPYVEAFLGGANARALEGEGHGALAAFAIEELAGLLGSDIRRRLTPMAETRWANDPWALGAYSHALPGCAGMRAALAQPVDGRIFFAGEATSPHAFSTAHGAWESGMRAADEALAALG